MYVIVDIAGQQFKVQKDQRSSFSARKAKPNRIEFDKVLLVDNEGKVTMEPLQ